LTKLLILNLSNLLDKVSYLKGRSSTKIIFKTLIKNTKTTVHCRFSVFGAWQSKTTVYRFYLFLIHIIKKDNALYF